MTLVQQLSESLFHSILALQQIKISSFRWLVTYFLVGLAVFSVFIWQLLEHQEAIKTIVLDYLFPKSWQSISEQLTLYLFESQTKQVIGNLILGASLVIASMFLFPIKEQFSAKFENDGRYRNGVTQEFPLFMQFFEEIKLLLFYVTAQLVILWIGYYPYAWTKWLSIVLSYIFLFFTFGLDLISPTFQRHKVKYSQILKFMFSKPLPVIAFGLLFSLPAVLLSQIIFTIESLSLIEISGVLFISNLFLLTFAVPAGTHVASRFMLDIRQMSAPSGLSKSLWYFGLITLLLVMSFLHARLVTSLHHKSQILKAEYVIDWGSFDFDLPSISQFLDGESHSKISFEVIVKNSTPYDIVIENSQILVEKDLQVVATVNLDGFDIPSRTSRRVLIKLDSDMDLSLIKSAQSLLKGWRVDLRLELWPGIPFIFNIAEQKE